MMQEANAPIHIDVALPGGVSREAPRGVLSFLEVVLAVSSVALTALILLYMTDVPYNVAALYISLAVFPAAMVFLCHKYGRISMAYLLLVIAAVCSLYYRYAWSGILVIANGFIATVNRLQGFTFILFETGVPAGLDTLYGTAALLVAIAIYSAAVAWGVTGRFAAAIFILTIPSPLLRTCLSLSLPLALLSMLGFAWVVLWIFCALDAKRKKAVNLFQKGELPLFAFMASTIAVIAAAAIALAAFSLLVPEGSAAISGGVTEVRAGILSGLDRIRYEKNSGVTELPRGDLRCVESLHYTYKDVLAVSLEKPRPIYLKSFTGSAYQGNRWSGLADEAFGGDYTGIFAWLGQHSFYAQSQLGHVGAMTMGAQRGWISVNNLALSSKYIFAPYETLPTQDLDFGQARYDKDLGILGKGFFGARNYTFDLYLPVIEDYGAADLHYWLGSEVTGSQGYQDYLQFETVYRTFAYDSYLEVPREEDALLREYFSSEAIDGLGGRDYRDIVKDIREFFTQAFTFSYEASLMDENANFIGVFLDDKTGYDVHFSALAALLMREAGIPARYAEGFYISPNDTALYAEGSSITFYLPDASAHAWVEIYADGIGWLPVDFTPGYFHLEKNERSNEGVVQLLKENPSYFYRADYEVPVEDEPPEEELQDAGFSLRGLILPLILLLLVLVYFGARGIYRGALRRRFNQADPRRSALYLYAFVNRVLLFDGIRTDPRAAYAVLPSTEGKYDLPELSLARFLDVVYKARFSARDRTLNQEEFGYLHNYKEAVVRSVYARQKAFKKLWMRFVWLI